MRIIFCEKAEAQCMPVAIASMLSKYLREALMRRFNAFWQRHLPQVTPTAGYYGDGERFLHDIDVKRKELGITDAELIPVPVAGGLLRSESRAQHSGCGNPRF